MNNNDKIGKYTFRAIDFCLLFIAHMKKENIQKFNLSQLPSDLRQYANDYLYNRLFMGLTVSDDEILEIKNVFWGLLNNGVNYVTYFSNEPNIWYVEIEPRQADIIMSNYCEQCNILMSQMIQEYNNKKNNIRLTKMI